MLDAQEQLAKSKHRCEIFIDLEKLIEAITSKCGSKISEDILSYCMESCLFIWISANVSGIIPCHFNSGPNSPHRKLHVVNISSHSSRVT